MIAIVALSELTKPMTVDEVKITIYNVLAAVSTDVTTWKPGAVVRTLITGFAIVVAALSSLVAFIATAGFLQFATGEWLRLLALHVYGVTRIEATFAAGNITLNNSGGGLFTFGIEALTVLNPTTGKTYKNTAGFTLNPLQTGLVVPVKAVESGSASTSIAGTITAFETALPGVTVTNAAALVGTDAEPDPALRQRCSDSLGIASPAGTPDAYTYFARTATKTGGTPVATNRARVVPGTNGAITVYLASATGAVTGTIGDLATDLGASDDNVQRKATPLAITATTASASAVATPIAYSLWIYTTVGKTDAEIKTLVANALTNLFARLPIGGDSVIPPAAGKLYRSAISDAISAVFPIHTFRVDLSTPANDVTLSVSQVATLGTVVPVVNFVKPAA